MSSQAGEAVSLPSPLSQLPSLLGCHVAYAMPILFFYPQAHNQDDWDLKGMHS